MRTSLEAERHPVRRAPRLHRRGHGRPLRALPPAPRRTSRRCRSTPRPSRSSCARWCSPARPPPRPTAPRQGAAEIVVGVPVPSVRRRLLRGVRPLRPRPHAARPRADPLRRRRRHHPPRHRARPLRQRALAAPAGRRVPGGGRHRRRRARHPPRRRRRRPRPRGPHQLLQRHGRPAAGADRARGAVQLRREPRAALAAHHPGRLPRGPRGATGTSSRRAPSGPCNCSSDDLRRFQRMVADLLEMSRADAGSVDVFLEEVERLGAGAALGRGRVRAHGRPRTGSAARGAGRPRRAVVAGGRRQAPLRACHGQPDGERRPLRWRGRPRSRSVPAPTRWWR